MIEQAKIADFGTSVALSYGQHEHNDTGVWSPMWASPEVLKWFKYSSKSESWMFGVLLWEIFKYIKIYINLKIKYI